MKKIFTTKRSTEAPGFLARWLNIILVGIFLVAIFFFALSKVNYKFDWAVIWDYRIKILKGYGMTFVIAFFSIIVSIFIGVLGAAGLQSRVVFLRYLSRAYVETIRGTPFLVQIIFFYFIIATAVGLNNKLVVGILILAVFSGAYVTEIIRGGIQSIPQSQWVTARALGFTRLQTYRYIVFPQVFRRILPALAGQMSSLVKDSSLLSTIAVSEFYMNVLEVNSLTFRTFELLAFMMIQQSRNL